MGFWIDGEQAPETMESPSLPTSHGEQANRVHRNKPGDESAVPGMADLFDSLDVGAWTLPNRLVMAPLTRNRAEGTVPGDLGVEYYSQRASAGLIITEGSQPTAEGQGYLNTPGFHSEEQLAGWRGPVPALPGGGPAEHGEEVDGVVVAAQRVVQEVRAGTRLEFGIAEGRRGAQALAVKVLDTPPSVTSNLRQRDRKGAEDMAAIATLERDGREVNPEGLAPAWD